MQLQSGPDGSIKLDFDNGSKVEFPATPGGGDPASRIKVSITPLRPATPTLVFTVPAHVGNEELRLFSRDAEPVPLAAPPAPPPHSLCPPGSYPQCLRRNALPTRAGSKYPASPVSAYR